MTSSIKIHKNVAIEVRDGTVLRADIYRLNDKQKHPAILICTQYDRLDWHLIFMPVIDTVLAGYALVMQNVRGTYDSEGKRRMDDPYLTEQGIDGYDTIEWIASQPWCDGNVGTAGGSYLGAIQWAIAKENPPHLKAMAPWVCGSGLIPSPLNGALTLGLFTTHLLMDGLALADRLEKQGKDVSRMRQLLNRGNTNPEEVYNFLPLKDVPQANFDVLREFWYTMLNPASGLESAEVHPAYEKIAIPCCHVSGWYDFFTNGTFYSFNNMREKGASQVARQGQHVIIGPWLHAGPFGHHSETGDLNFGYFATALGSKLGDYNLAFFNKYLRGIDADLPAVHYFVMGKNIWQDAEAWPLPQTRWQRFFLHSKGHANTSGGDGLLSRNEPGPEPADVYMYNPHFPVPTTGCRGGGLCGSVGSPRDQSFIERRDDVLCYTTPEFKEDLEVTGPLELHLYAATSARDTDFVAKLVDVWPDGHAYNLGDGIVRARYRKSFLKPEFVTPGEVNEYIINLETTSQLVKKGHRIRIDVTSSNFPEYDRNMNTGSPPGEDAKGITARQTIYHQREYTSYIDLPVIDSHG